MGRLCVAARLFQLHELIGARAHADFLGVLEGLFPMHVGVGVEEVVVVALPVLLCEVVGELAVWQRRRLEAGIRTGLVERHRVERGKHALVRQDRRIVLATLSAIAAAAGLALFVFQPANVTVLLVLTAIYGAMANALYPIAVSHANDFASPEDFVKVSGGLLLLYGIGTVLTFRRAAAQYDKVDL